MKALVGALERLGVDLAQAPELVADAD